MKKPTRNITAKTVREALNKFNSLMVRQAQDERIKSITVCPELAPQALPLVVEGIAQSFLSGNQDSPLPNSPLSLQALTAAALILPGLLHAPAQAAEEEDSIDFQYSHYQEGKRGNYVAEYFSDGTTGFNGINNISKSPYRANPIEVDSVHGSGRFSLTDRVKVAFNYLQDTWSGATPIGTAPAILGANGVRSVGENGFVYGGASPWAQPTLSNFYMDRKGNIFSRYDNFLDGSSQIGSKQNQLTHVLSYASPETRKQGDFSLSYNWDEAAVNVGGGISVENDYESRFVNLGGRMDFNQKRTTVNLGLSYTNSDTFAKLDPDALPYLSTEGYDEQNIDPITGEFFGYRPIANAPAQIESPYNPAFPSGRSQALLRGKRQDWGTQLGLTQVLSKNSLLELGFGYTRSTGYLANPYKLVYVLQGGMNFGDDPNQPVQYSGKARLEKRPEERNQFNWNLGYQHYIELFDAALHFDYHFAHDDWGINAHTFEADWVQPLGSGWTVTPRIRYYSQSGADFYTPFVTTLSVADPITGEVVKTAFSRELPKFYSSDQRLSGFGALSGGVTLEKRFAKGISVETGFEYYSHQGGLKIGSGGEQNFADYDYWVANAALKVNLESIGAPGSSGGHSEHHHHHTNSPAGVMFDHVLEKSGEFMVGYRYMRNEQAGGMRYGSNEVSPNTVQLNGCGDRECQAAPDKMNMSMHMLDLMVAPTDWLTLMLMPQWVDMDMSMTKLADMQENGHRHGDAVHDHQSGGIGDTGVYALFKLFNQSGHHINLSLGGTAPTGDVNIKLRKTETLTNGSYDVPLHYGMQLGSGTWDFKPSLTYTGEADKFSWGAQLTGTKRLENKNSANFAFGDIFQGSIWGGYQWTNWLTTTVRGVYTTQGGIRGQYLPVMNTRNNPPIEFVPMHVGTFDKTSNYGGQYVDLGLGVNVTVPDGAFVGNSFKFEWLQPINTHYNGYQLDRDGALSFTWSYGF